jgi:hypothetical protein
MNPTRDLVLTKIAHTFPNHAPAEILAILDRYGTKPHHPERDRVHLAILMLSEGKLDKLDHYVNVADQDYRDVLSWAEYPEQSCTSTWKLDPADPKLAEILRRDREQYLAWLHGNHSQ